MKNALIVVDMVNDFTREDGLVFYPENKVILPRINKLIKYFHKTNQLVVFVKHTYRKDKFDKNLLNMRPCCIEGTGGNEIDSSLEVLERDYQIKKRRYSSFYYTDLDLILRENDIKRIIVVGTKTNNCIRATVEDGYYLDYDVYVASDCVATNSNTVNRVHLEDIDKYLGTVKSSDEIINILERDMIKNEEI